MPLLKQRNFESRLTSIKYQVLKNYPDLTDAQKVAAAQSIYDAAIGADTSLDINALPTFAFGNVDLIWSNNGKSVEISAGSVSISDDLSDEEKVIVPGLDPNGISIIYPGNTLPTGSQSLSGVGTFTYTDLSGVINLPLNNDIDRTKLTFKIFDMTNNVWANHSIPNNFFVRIEGESFNYIAIIDLISEYSDNYFKIEGPGYKTLYVRYFIQYS